MTIAASLEAAIAAAIPRTAFSGVAIGAVSKGEALSGPVDVTDKTRWRVRFTDQATDADKAAAAAVIAAFDPASVKPERRVDFENAIRRLTDQEWSALKAACDSSVQMARWYERAKTRGSIDLNDPEVRQALAAVIQAGLFTKARLVELFAAPLD